MTKIMWVETRLCHAHNDAQCDCDGIRYSVWHLFFSEQSQAIGGAISQFSSDAPYYGTWEINGGGRTGPIDSLEQCKKMVEEEAARAVRPN